ncbi:PEP/pyruvate-binding domain-containing protein [Amycolatopsis sp. A133]|uniref:PEP/pyruvate-binding domain-containing protein n=1 Tax=Amycolatopsis sp. A133 TaxID=3064472 RepID=UPI0027EF6EC1|nr:PEP/pyruvate-binding domain-containing protein [Amycolatopsis sp. A133]MDQ7803490.1 PEP/pyruvate-binding domain-containing protein [Amycolatopsis sp. A133]
MSNHVCRLDEVSRADAEAVGRKAGTLGELLSAGFPVPDGFVLTVDAFGKTGGEEDLAQLREPVRAALAELGADDAWAVRSSGVDEDLAGGSFAGQYESVLDVRGLDAVLDAVKVCWDSAGSDRVASYRQGRGIDGSGRMAVLVQRMVPAEAAGVAFSANPVSGDRAEAVVSAVRGLADRLVSGQATADEWVVRDQAQHRSGTERAITPEQACGVAELARRVERHFGAAQDIEWAIDGGEIMLLQARPITALPEAQRKIEFEVPEGFWLRDSYLRRPWTPMQRSLLQDGLNEVNWRLFEYGLMYGFEYRDIGGWSYLRFVPLGERTGERVGRIIGAVAAGEPARVVERWYTEWQPDIEARVKAMRDRDLTGLSDTGLAEHLQAARVLSTVSNEVHFRVGGASSFVWGELGFTCSELLGWDAFQALRLIVGVPGKTTEPGLRLTELARMAAADPAVRELLPSGDTARILAADAEFATAFGDYLREYGSRTMGQDITQPTLAEQPELVLRLVEAQLKSDSDPEAEFGALAGNRERAYAEAVAGLDDAQRDRLAEAVRLARRSYPVRDDSAFYTHVMLAVLRRGVLELGGRLAARGLLADPADVFLLDLAEALDALRDGADRRELADVRRAERAWATAHVGPPFYGEPPQQPSEKDSAAWLDSLDPASRRTIEIVLWVGRTATPVAEAQATATGLRGLAASGGRYTGTVRVILDETEFHKLRPGDVLVCPETNAQWSVLFGSVGALVTDTGSILSHPAIIAREYQVPAVVATGNGTHVLRDGQLVTVDGDSGTVDFIES